MMEKVGRRYWWERKGYEKLNESGRRRTNRIQMGRTSRRRFWRIKVTPKVKFFKTASPKKFLVWLRDAYVNMMMRLANSRVMGGGYGGALGDGFGRGPRKEYDEKMIVEIYKSIVKAQGNLVSCEAGKLGSEVVCRIR